MSFFDAFLDIDEFLKLLVIMVGDERYREIIDEMKNREENKGGETMCEIYDQIEQQGIEKGIQEGILIKALYHCSSLRN